MSNYLKYVLNTLEDTHSEWVKFYPSKGVRREGRLTLLLKIVGSKCDRQALEVCLSSHVMYEKM